MLEDRISASVFMLPAREKSKQYFCVMGQSHGPLDDISVREWDAKAAARL